MKYGLVNVDRHQEIKRRTGVHLEVFLDGKRVKDCIEADDINGFVVIRKRNEAGELYLVNGNTELARERLTGLVEFKPKEN